jgi:hypothetical protein
MYFVLNEIGMILREQLAEINPQNILLGKPKKIPPANNLPLVAIYDKEFEMENIGIGSLIGEKKIEKLDEFNGDGKKTQFKLKNCPLKPLQSVEITSNFFREFHDYKVNYSDGEITFKSPPSLGKNNIKIKYIPIDGTSQIKGLKLKIEYYIDIWAQNYSECDSITFDIVKAILISEEKMIDKGIRLIPVKGFSILDELYINESDSSSRYGRRLVYIADTYIKFEIKAPPIKDIKISEK